MKEKLTITMERELIEKIKRLAKLENRSVSNMIEMVIKTAIEGNKGVNHD